MDYLDSSSAMSRFTYRNGCKKESTGSISGYIVMVFLKKALTKDLSIKELQALTEKKHNRETDVSFLISSRLELLKTSQLVDLREYYEQSGRMAEQADIKSKNVPVVANKEEHYRIIGRNATIQVLFTKTGKFLKVPKLG